MVGVFGPQGLALAPDVARHHFPGRFEDPAGGTVVLLQADGRTAGVIPLESENVADFRPPPAVDGLVVVADNAEVAVPRGEQVDQPVLDLIGVLELVHQDVEEALAVFFENWRMFLKEANRVKKQVAEVEGVSLLHPRLVALVYLRQQLAKIVFPGHVFREKALVLGAVDGGGGRPGLECALADVQILEEGLQQAFLVLVIVDGEGGGKPQGTDLAAQDAHAGGVEGAHPGEVGGFQKAAQPLLHLGGGLVGEGDGKDAPRLDAFFPNQPGDPVGQGPRLPRPRTGQKEQRPSFVQDGLALPGIEAPKEVIHRPLPRGCGPSGRGCRPRPCLAGR
jgi:hypothetical protein